MSVCYIDIDILKLIFVTVNSKELTIDNFTFFKEPIGLNDSEKEVIRDAKRIRVCVSVFIFLNCIVTKYYYVNNY